MTVSARPHPILLSYWFSTSHCTLWVNIRVTVYIWF
jgi:hypothetical protein